MWWENLKMKLIIGGILLTILIVIITIIIVETKGEGNSISSVETTQREEDGSNDNGDSAVTIAPQDGN